MSAVVFKNMFFGVVGWIFTLSVIYVFNYNLYLTLP